jgi:hypothetical protein
MRGGGPFLCAGRRGRGETLVARERKRKRVGPERDEKLRRPSSFRGVHCARDGRDRFAPEARRLLGWASLNKERTGQGRGPLALSRGGKRGKRAPGEPCETRERERRRTNAARSLSFCKSVVRFEVCFLEEMSGVRCVVVMAGGPASLCAGKAGREKRRAASGPRCRVYCRPSLRVTPPHLLIARV